MNKQPIIVFSPQWFLDHQAGLLRLLNSKPTRRWFRRVLRIRDCDVGYNEEIFEINAWYYAIYRGSQRDECGNLRHVFTIDVRTHRKYAKRLYYAFLPLWKILHALDAIANTFRIPQFGFGFDTLTQYPDTGSGGTTCDGIIGHNPGKTYLDTRDDASGDSADATSAEVNQGGGGTGTDIYLHRTIYNFDTSPIGSGVISSGETDVYIRIQNYTARDVNIIGCTPAAVNNLQTSDYSCYSALDNPTKYGSADQNLPVATIDAYKTFSLTQGGLGYIKKSGVTSFMIRDTYDMTGTAPGNYADSFWNHADQTGNNKDPKMVITYTVGSEIVKPNNLRPAIFKNGIAK